MEPSKQPPRAEAGVVIGGYELVRRLGRGGMADVWVAKRTTGAAKSIAIKLLADHYVGDERYTRMFRAEVELAAILSHANIVQVFDEGEEDGRSYMVMEWVDGFNLLKLGAVLALLDDDQRRFRIIAYVIGQLLYALGYAHSITSSNGNPLGVVHRDVSPQNVLVSNHGEVKLTDFGVAYQVMEESSGIHVKGKVRYMSPEQLGGKTRSPTVDLYAVGALLHELLDGKKFRVEYDDGQELLTAVLTGEIPPMTRSIPPELDELRLGLLAPDPADRIQTAEEAIAWLQRYPDYGDARGELTKVCNTVTGFVRPRAGPGQSSQVPAADGRTTQWKPKGLAKPRLSPEPNPPSQPAPAPVRASPPVATAAIITGDTEFIRPQQPVGPGKKQLFGAPSGAATAPLPARARNLAVAREPAAHPSSPPVPAPAAGLAVVPSPAMPAYPVASPVPQEVIDSRSHPIAVPDHRHGQPVPALAPTERLSSSEASGARAGSNATEVLDASMIVEVTSGSGTDREIAPAIALREGTDTSREIRPQAVAPSHSISIVVQKRSAVAMLVVGLLLVAAMSVTVTWWLFTRNRGEDQRAASDAALESPQPASTPASVPAQPTPTIEEAEPSELRLGPPPEPAPSPVEPTPSPVEPAPSPVDLAPAVEPLPTPVEPAPSPVEPAPSPSEPTDRQADDERPASTDPVIDTDAPAAPAGPKPSPPKVAVTVRALPGMANGQLKIGGTLFDIPKGGSLTKKLPPGKKKKVEWRTDPKAQWKADKAIDIEAGKPLTIQLMFTGPRKAPQ